MSYVEQPSSMRALIESLEVGETYARAQRFDGNDGEAITKDNIFEAMRAMRLGMQPTTFRITKRTGYQYKIEAGEFRTDMSRDICIVIIVTRTE